MYLDNKIIGKFGILLKSSINNCTLGNYLYQLNKKKK
jgi:hypothetical protein